MARFLFTEWDGGGSLPPELTVIRRTIEAGHTVTVIGDPVAEAEVRAIGVRDFRPWVDAPHHDTRDPQDDYLRDWEIRSPVRQLTNILDRLMVGPAPAFAAETLTAIDDVRPDAVVSSFPLFGALIAAEVRALPCAVLVPNVVALPAEGMPPYGTGMLPAAGPLGRVRDRTLNAFVERLWNTRLDALNRVRASFSLPPLSRLLEQWERQDRVLALTSAAFDFPAALPPNVRYVGPQLDDPEWAEPWTPGQVDGRPLVLVAMSTTFMDHVGQLQRAVTALAGLPVHGLVTTGPAIDPAQIEAPPNVTVVRSAPHADVLAHAAAVVTHAGHGTVIKALSAGVPLVCLPTGRDQPDNAARVTARGAGIRLPKRASPRRIRSAVQRIVEDPAYSAAAQRLGDLIRTQAGSGAVVTELEALAPRATAPPTGDVLPPFRA